MAGAVVFFFILRVSFTPKVANTARPWATTACRLSIDESSSRIAVVRWLSARRAPLKDDGTFGEWEEMASLPKARAHVHHTPVHAGRFYSVGGNIGSHFTQDVVLMGNLY